MKTKIKVCGLTQPKEIEELTNLEIDYLGFIFYEKSPRYVLNHLTLQQISIIRNVKKVGVFVNETIENIHDISKKAKLNYVQLHGDESPQFIQDLKSELNPKIEIIKVVRVGNDLNDFAKKMSNLEIVKDDISFLLFDTDTQFYGGSGQTFDWQLLDILKINSPYILSGGLSLDNHGLIQGIKQTPAVLDINSKFEISPGVKDLNKIKDFISKIKNDGF